MECVNCQRMFDPVDLVEISGNSVCVECKPAMISKMREGAVAPSATFYQYGGFWIRFGARLLDGLIMFLAVGIPIGIIIAAIAFSVGAPAIEEFFENLGEQLQNGGGEGTIMIISLAVAFIGVIIGALYEVYFVVKKGGTLGKLALGLKIINSDGTQKISIGKAIGRYICQSGQPFSQIPLIGSIIGFVLFIGHIMAGFDCEKRALHDRMCGTRVVKK